MQLRIFTGVAAQIRAHAGDARPEECCGLLLGSLDEVTQAVESPNVAASPLTRFEVSPELLLATHRGAREGGPALVGCYHSHPSGDLTPSPRDAAMATAEMPLWIIATPQRLAAWLWTVNGTFRPVDLVEFG